MCELRRYFESLIPTIILNEWSKNGVEYRIVKFNESDIEILSEIDFADGLVGEDFGRFAVGDDAAFADDAGLLADVEGFPHVVIG